MPTRKKTKTDALTPFHPLVRTWFHERVGTPSAPQQAGWPAIASGDHALILAPTGTGKTLAAFLWELNALITEGIEAPLANAVHLLYISPLKALNNDVRRNLERPLEELRHRFEAAGQTFPDLRVAVRTGDTPTAERQRMLRKTPHILITTPESLHILLTSVRGREIFSSLRAVIVDEIHAIAGTKRGAHLALTLERLEHRCRATGGVAPQRIGLSATQKPLEEIARFLGGSEGDGSPRPVSIIDCGLVKPMEIAIQSPIENLNEIGGTIWPAVYPALLERIRASRTTLIFVNNRAQAERIAAKINAIANEEIAQPYHGSLARERRFLLERALKNGELRALVATSSLELGIDIGSVDLVVQVSSPKRVSSGLQRVGRAGHTLAAVSRGVVIPLFRDDALEALAIADGMRSGDVEPTSVVFNALDVLSQVIVAEASVDEWTSQGLFELVRRAYPYHALSRAAFDETLSMLAGKYPADVASELEARVTWDRSNDRVAGSRGGRLTAVVSGGTIPDRGYYTVNLPDRTRLGELDEEFVHESRIGDVFQLGSSTWRVQAIEHDRVIVVPAPGAPARMPFWHGEFMARSFHLSARLGQLRRELDAARDAKAITAIAQRYGSDEATVRSLVEYVHRQRAATGHVPDDRTLLIEQFRDDVGSVRIVLHAPFGGRVNAPWGMALAQRVKEVLRDVEVQVQTTDDGIMLRLPDLGTPMPLETLMGLGTAEAERRVLDEVGGSSLFGARFRMNAARALLLPRGSPRRRMPLWLQRLKSLDLLQTVRSFPSFPILVETYRDVLQDAFDMSALASVLEKIEAGEIRIQTARTEVASPFSASLQFGFVMDWLYGDDTPRAEQRAALLSLDRALLDELMGGSGADEGTLDALADVLARRRGTSSGRRARTADELAVLLDRAGDLTLEELRERVASPEEGVRDDALGRLLESRRIVGLQIPTSAGRELRYTLVENYPRYVSAFGESSLAEVVAGVDHSLARAVDVIPEPLRHSTLTRSAARRELLWRWMALAGAVSIADAQARYAFPTDWIRSRFTEWERTSRIVRGVFGGDRTVERWAARKPLEIARRRELALARRSIEAVGLDTYAAFLQRWQHLDPRERLGGPDGLRELLHQFEGLPRAAEGWEREYLPARLTEYDRRELSRLTGTGEFVWIGSGTYDEKSGGRTLTHLRFVSRGRASLWIGADEDERRSEAADAVLRSLTQMGAAFIEDIERMTGLAPSVVKSALRELVAAGLVTNDTAEALREVLRWRAVMPGRSDRRDPTRWLPADFTASPDRPIVQRRPNARRLPKWRRPDLAEPASGWVGRWSLVRTPSTMGGESTEEERAAAIAETWLARYGIVSRDWWKRERPNASWGMIYRELRRLEFRGDVRRGYFIRGLGGAQFALPSAIELLRSSAAGTAEERGDDVLVMAASDPANPYALPLAPEFREAATRPRGKGALLVTLGGRVVLSVEGRGRSIQVGAGMEAADVERAARVLALHLTRRSHARAKTRDIIIETIAGSSAATSALASAFAAAGFRRAGRELRYYAGPA